MIAQVSGEGTPLIAIHGFGVDYRIMLPLEDMADNRPWKRIYLNLPWAEHAEDNGARNPREVADAALHEIQEIVGDGKFAIVGNSFGAMVARYAAHILRGQCLGLATLAGVFELDHSVRTLPEYRVVVSDATVLEKAGRDLDSFAEMAVLQTDEALKLFREFVLPGLRGSNQEIVDRIHSRYLEGYSPEQNAQEPFDAPSLHVFGRQDQVVGFADGLVFKNHYTRGTFVVLDAAGHNLHLEQSNIVGALIRDWLDRMDPTTLRPPSK